MLLNNIEKQKAFTWEEFNNIEPEFRKKRWDEFKAVFPEHAEQWEDVSACAESKCKYANNGWCYYVDFPCAYNPYFSPRTGYVGMACMGAVPDDHKK